MTVCLRAWAARKGAICILWRARAGCFAHKSQYLFETGKIIVKELQGVAFECARKDFIGVAMKK